MIQEQQQAQQLFDVLFDGDDMVELRLLGHGVTPKSRFFDSPGMAIYDWEWITERIEEGYNVYFGVNPRSERSGKAESIQYARCMFADFDDVADLDELKSRLEGLPPYSAIVHSGNGYHVYWRLTSRENDMKRWSYYQRGIIAHCKSDKAIHDPPRIMRLPGTINHKNGATCTVVELTGHTIDEDIAQVFPEPPNAKALYGTPDGQQAVLEGKCLPLSRRVEEWLHGDKPAQQGERHDVLMQASLEVVANGWPIEALERVVRRRAREDGLEDDEIDKVFEYALSKRGTLTPSLNNVPKEYEDAHTGETIEHRVRPRFSNVIRAKSQMDDGKEMDFFKPVDMVAEELKRGTGGWPALAKGVLFYPTGDENVPFRIISNCNQLFSYIFSATEPRWVSNKDLITPSSNELRSAITKQEFYEYLCNEMDDYRGIATLPHEPPMPGIWYAPVKLPEPSGRLDELIDRMNGETDLDNQIIKAMFATPFWGGPCGARPMFVIRSRFGKATGKSTTADIAISLAGMAAEASAHEDWEKIARKLVGNTAMDGRVVRLDNVKGGRLSSGEMESAITAPEIEGHRMYKGSARRMNDLTWIMTANTPNLSTDLATRSVVINIGDTRHSDTDFKSWLDAFIAQYRLEIIADLLHFLRSERTAINPKNNGRFAEWTRGVLGCFENSDELAAHVADQRVAVDTERQDAEEWREHFAGLIQERFPTVDLDACNVIIANNVLHDHFVEHGHTDLRVRGFKSEMAKLGGNGPLKHVTYDRALSGHDRGKRGWRWCTDPEAKELFIGHNIKIIPRHEDTYQHGGDYESLPGE